MKKTSLNVGRDKTSFDLEQYLFFWVGQIDALYSRSVTKTLKPLGVNLTTWRALALLERMGVMTVSQLAELSAIERSSLSRTVDVMEQRGLITRVGRKNDKRMLDVQITQAGSELYYKILPHVMQRNQIVLHDADPEELRIAIEVLKKIRANFF